MKPVDRRSFLKYLSSAAATATFYESIEKAAAIPASSRSGTIDDVEHVVFLMQENRAFDHYFGALRGVRGFGDPHPARFPSGRSVWHQPDGSGFAFIDAPEGYEIVLGNATAGVIPGVVVASIMQTDFASLTVTRQQEGAQPTLVSGPPSSIRGRRVLVVDETCDTGSTMKLALSEVRALRPAEVRTAVSFKTGEYSPDFHAFETDSFIILPWDREIIQGGEIVIRPDYAARL